MCHFFTNIMADDNDNRILALAALELVRRHVDLRLIEPNSHIHDLTLELAIVRNERDQSRAEMEEGEELVADDLGFNLGM